MRDFLAAGLRAENPHVDPVDLKVGSERCFSTTTQKPLVAGLRRITTRICTVELDMRAFA
jgi:hypothetical protein